MANGDGLGNKATRGPHPATIQRQKAAPASRAQKPPHPATVQKKSAAAGGGRKERAPHPATLSRSGGSAGAVQRSGKAGRASFVTAEDGSLTLSSGATVFYGATHSALQAMLRGGFEVAPALAVSTTLEGGSQGLGRSGGVVVELQTTRALRGQNAADSRGAVQKASAKGDKNGEDAPEFELDRRVGRSVQCRMNPAAQDALSPAAVYARDANGAWTRFTVSQYRDMVGA